MISPNLAGWLFYGGMILYAIVDIFLVKDKIPGNTWSEVSRMWAEKTLIIPWALGIVLGHWFHWWPAAANKTTQSNIFTLVWLTSIVFIASSVITRHVNPFPNFSLMAALQLGILAGAFFWRV